MVHYSCDRCKKLINTDECIRYVVRIEVETAMPTGMEPDPADCDHLDQLSDTLNRGDVGVVPAIRAETFDLCSACYRQYMLNPLSSDVHPQLEFSQN